MSDQQRFHEVAAIFPMMSSDEIDRLAEDIKANGLREPIWQDKPNGLIIDGRNRFLACHRANVEPRFRVWDGKGHLVAFVVSLNLHRRHLDESQRAMVAAKLATLPKGVRQDRSIDLSTTQEEAAATLNVSVPSVKRAREVHATGAPELVEAVERGKVSVSAAADIAKAPQEQQREIVARGKKEIIKAAADIRKAERAEKAAKREDMGKPRVLGIGLAGDVFDFVNKVIKKWPEDEDMGALFGVLSQLRKTVESIELKRNREVANG